MADKPVFEHRHYEKLAKWWKRRGEISSLANRQHLDLLYRSFCNELAEDNPRFNQRLFDLASGYDRVA